MNHERAELLFSRSVSPGRLSGYNTDNDNERISRAPFHVKHAQFR